MSNYKINLNLAFHKKLVSTYKINLNTKQAVFLLFIFIYIFPILGK